MAKRMKTVFSSHSQVAHVWAQQTQESGKAGNLYFENTTDLYSYGSHYLAARIHTLPSGQKIALIRSDSYSSSTSGHLSDARSAVNGLMTYFEVPDVRNINSLENFNHFNDLVLDRIESELKSIKVERESSISLNYLNYVVDEANEFFKVAGFPLITLPQELKDTILDHLEFRFQRYNELNTPENRAKNEAKRARKLELEEIKNAKKLESDIDLFRLNGTATSALRNKPYALLHVSGNTVYTSNLAQVPLSDALKMLAAIESGRVKAGEKVGHFSFERFEGHADQRVIKIGCHRIELSEAQAVLNPYRTNLKLVDEA